MLGKILKIYLYFSIGPALAALGLLIGFNQIYLAVGCASFIILLFFLLGLAFHSSMASVIEELENILSNIRIEAMVMENAKALGESEPLFDVEREEEM